MTEAASDRELIELLGGRGEIVDLSRQRYGYATSAPLEEIHVRMAGGGEMTLIFKDLSRDRMLGDARATKPAFLHQPGREIESYRRILSPEGVGARCIAAVADPDRSRHWLLIEKVPGVELWQIGELGLWEEVAWWLGGFHARFAGRLDDLRAANPYLLEHSESWFRSWGERAREALARSTDRRAPALLRALERYDEAITSLAALPRTFVHGEFYPSNVLVVREENPPRVCPVDWELAAVGPGVIDLAALVGGWNAADRRRLTGAYLDGLDAAAESTPSPEAFAVDLARGRLHLALQWLGWSAEWRPPREHAQDWMGEALLLTRELGLA